MMISVTLINDAEDQHKENIEEWGHQHPETLMAVLGEEIGEVNKAFLQSYYGHEDTTTKDLQRECIDAIAVLVEIHQEIGRWDYDNLE